jgi:hypothetical protein
MATRIGTKAYLVEENARLRAELDALKATDIGTLTAQLKFASEDVTRLEARCDKQAAELTEVYKTQQHLDDGTWITLMKERTDAAELLDCHPEEIVSTLRTLRDDMGCEKDDTLIERTDVLTLKATAYGEEKAVSEALSLRCNDYEDALNAAIEDRRALLARLGLTDYAWSAQGGACWADVEV